MATRRNYEERYNEDDYDYPRRRSNGPAWVMAAVMICGLLLFGAWLLVDMFPKDGGAKPGGAIGNQAPPAAVRRVTTSSAPVQVAPIPGIAQSQAEADRMYQEAIAKGEANAPALPLNSQGEPVISEQQRAQQQLSLQLAEQEGNAAADKALAAQRAAANADAVNRAPDVSYQEAVDLLHRDPCHVPRANPATCAQGLFKPTPVN